MIPANTRYLQNGHYICRRCRSLDSTKCFHGHIRTAENTYIRKGGVKRCRECRNSFKKARGILGERMITEQSCARDGCSGKLTTKSYQTRYCSLYCSRTQYRNDHKDRLNASSKNWRRRNVKIIQEKNRIRRLAFLKKTGISMDKYFEIQKFKNENAVPTGLASKLVESNNALMVCLNGCRGENDDKITDHIQIKPGKYKCNDCGKSRMDCIGTEIQNTLSLKGTRAVVA